jgi:hypothetical protein
MRSRLLGPVAVAVVLVTASPVSAARVAGTKPATSQVAEKKKNVRTKPRLVKRLGTFLRHGRAARRDRRAHEVGREARKSNPWLSRRNIQISHQGGTLDQQGFGQNTMLGYRRGVERGWWIDTDVRDTKATEQEAAELIAFHNPQPGPHRGTGRNVDRSGRNKPISETPKSEVDANIRVIGPDGEYSVPTFGEIATGFAADPISVEAKTVEAARLLVEYVNKHPELRLLDRAVFYGMSGRIARTLREGLGPRAATGISKGEVIKLLGASLLSKLGWRNARIKTSADIAALPHNLAQLRPVGDRAPGWVRRVFQANLISHAVVDTARRSGLKTFAWTVDDPARAKQLVGRGVDAIFSDRPELVFPALKEAP